MNIGFIGLGLMGGSIAKAIRHFYPDTQIMAYDKNRETLSQALSDKVIDHACTTIDEQFAPSDYIFLCAPVSHNSEYLSEIEKYVSEDCILTDVGSVKTRIHEKAASLGLEHRFIGGHPMAGSERSGYANSKRHLIENAYFVITPSAKVAEKKVNAYAALIRSLKALPLILNYGEHDYITAAISHLPHIIASSLVNMVNKEDSKEGLMKMIAAGGFKDITRIASSSPVMWQQICMNNAKNIIKVIDAYTHQLNQMKTAIHDHNKEAIYEQFNQAKEYRNSIPDATSGPIKRSYSIYCDIIDETGSIATMATILATNGISIKNIGIIHSREFEEGVLRVAFYDQQALTLAAALLERHRYSIYKR